MAITKLPKVILLGIVLFTISFKTVAQNREEFSKEVEVTRRYNPEVGDAQKLGIIPNMVDTVALKPAVNYSINPTQWETAFGLRPINPVSISTAVYSRRKLLYVRLGAGFPLQTLADIYHVVSTNSNSTLGLYANHDGQWGKITNDLGEKRRATEVLSRGGAYFTKEYSKKSLSVELGVINRQYKPYGAFELPSHPLPDFYGDTDIIRYNDFGLKLALGDRFEDMERLNFGMELSTSYFGDRNDNDQFDLGAGLRFGQALREGTLGIAMQFDYLQGLNSLSDYENYTISISPEYSFSKNRFDLNLGAGLIYDSRYNGGSFVIIPKASIRYMAAHAFVPYFELDGGVTRGDFRSLSYANPYIKSGTTDENGIRWSGKVGFGGSVGRKLTYDIYFGGDYWRDNAFFANLYNVQDGSTRFTTFRTDNASVFYPAASLNILIVRGVNLTAEGRYNIISADDVRYNGSYISPGISIPDYEVTLGVNYEYRNQFFASVWADFGGKASHTITESVVSASNFIYLAQDEEGSIDLNIELEYKIRNGFSVFAVGKNLLNQSITIYNHYPLQGTNVMLGVKLAF